jgi:protein-S-isoprenylcysteine O-methyltransferase Ste14
VNEKQTGPGAKIWLSLACFVLVLGILIFVPAGTFRYWQAWVLLAVYLGSSVLILVYFLRKGPGLTERRMRSGPAAEKEKIQKIPVFFIILGYGALFVVSAVDFRYQWSEVPFLLVILGDLFVAAGWFIVFLVFRENSFASATIEVSGDQRVISTGPYAVVRHPMYTGTILWSAGIPLGLGSYWGLAGLAIMIPFIIFRIVHEERYLSGHLPGYAEYLMKVPSRLLPGIF